MPETDPIRSLSDRSAAALDALVEAGFRADGAPDRVRSDAQRVLGLLRTLTPPPSTASADRSLVDVTMARVLRAGGRRMRESEPAQGGRLLRDDAEAIDALVDNEWDAETLPGRHARRARRAVRLLGVLEPGSQAWGSDDLVARTMRRVQAEGTGRFGLPPEAPVIGGGGGFRLPDLVAVAALLFLCATLFFPTMTRGGAEAVRTACESSMSNAGVGFAMYANDHRGRRPAVSGSIPASLPGTATWWDVGAASRSHSANLFVLARDGYVEVRDLACEGNRSAPVLLDPRSNDDWRTIEEVSYSYQLFTDRDRARPVLTRMVLIADKSPVAMRSAYGQHVDPEARSQNHNARGQNVLFADRSVEWLIRPVTRGGDNIWLPASLTGKGPVRLQGNEAPEHAGDAFVGP